MLNIVSILIGLVGLLFAIFGLVPLLGWINWAVIGVAVLGAGIGVLSRHTMGRNLNILVLIVATVRLFMGGGII